MTAAEWDKLQPDDVIGSIVNGKQLLPVKLALKDHNQRWIVYRLNNSRQPVEALFLDSTGLETWRKL